VGPYPAMSALMALREWGLKQVEQRPVGEVVEQILSMGESIAFVAVALSVLITRIDDVTDELAPFLEQPDIWHLESARFGHENSGIVYPLTNNDPLLMQFDRVAMYHLMRSKNDQKVVLKEAGEQLVRTTREHLTKRIGSPPDDTHQQILLARKWAGLLDYDLYRFEKADQEGMKLLHIDYPTDLIEGLNAKAVPSELNLRIANIFYAAIRIRDGEADGNAVELWEQAHETLKLLKAQDIKLEPYEVTDVTAGVAAGLLVSVHEAKCKCTDITLQRAAIILVKASKAVLPATANQDGYNNRGVFWSMGADKSAATALPLLLISPQLLKRTGLSLVQIEQALVKLARGVSKESRQRLATAIAPLLENDCTQTDKPLHDLAMKVLEELVRSAGFAEKKVDYRVRPVHLSGILAKKLATDKHILYLSVAADAIPSLVQAARLKCTHSTEANEILRALIDHDLLAWPKHYAGHHYADAENWRSSIDAYTAERILSGDDALLESYLTAFEQTPEDLYGLLYRLAEKATGPDTGKRLLEIWPKILERLLPIPRAEKVEKTRMRVSSRDTDELDRALLPIPNGKVNWPPEPLFIALGRWGNAFRASPRLLDRLIKALATFGIGLQPEVTSFVLNVAGEDYERVLRNSALIIPWMRLILLGDKPISDADRTKLIQFLDKLARTGDTDALELQRELET
jgi:hypothetical protein